jgi:dTDP-4-amino-4,6-dideoxygalactose transaminase
MPVDRPDKFIVFGAPDIRQAEIDEVVDSLESGWLGTGPKVRQFEEEFARFRGVDNSRVAGVNSCTAALHVSMLAAGIENGDEVITTAMTFCATANAVIHAGGTPVPVDIEPDTLNIDPNAIEAAISPRTRAIIPVHFAGRPCDMDRIFAIADKHDLLVIEDCAHAIETEWRGVPAGTQADFGCFSFYVTKNITTGEGGMVIARSADAIDRIKVLSLHGMTKDAWHRFGDKGYKHYRVVDAGFKYNMMDLQAAIGIHQLNRVEAAWKRRTEIWSRYQGAFADLPVGRPEEPEADTRHGYHLYTLTIDSDAVGMSRDEFLAQMQEAGIGVGVHYQCLASHPYYQERFGWRPEDYSVAYAFGEATVSLPLSSKLTDGEVDYIIDITRSLVDGRGR